MPPIRRFLPRQWSLFAVLVATVTLLLGGAARTARVSEPPTGPAMSDASMRRWLSTWYGAHPAHGAAAVAGGAADTFRVSNFRFDGDGVAATTVDTVKILAGQSVMWKLVGGFHTSTSGNPDDLDAGSIWDLPVDPTHTEQVVAFPNPGTYPFHCRPHGAFFNMMGVVVVSAPTTGVPPAAAGAEVGFVAPPWPNPAQAGARFRFRVDRAGAVRLRILDASGRVVARVLDRLLEPGVHEAASNARAADGARARAGTYWALLDIHGTRSSTKVVLAR